MSVCVCVVPSRVEKNKYFLFKTVFIIIILISFIINVIKQIVLNTIKMY